MALPGFFHVSSLCASPYTANRHCVRDRVHILGMKKRKKDTEEKLQKNHFAVTRIWTHELWACSSLRHGAMPKIIGTYKAITQTNCIMKLTVLVRILIINHGRKKRNQAFAISLLKPARWFNHFFLCLFRKLPKAFLSPSFNSGKLRVLLCTHFVRITRITSVLTKYVVNDMHKNNNCAVVRVWFVYIVKESTLIIWFVFLKRL